MCDEDEPGTKMTARAVRFFFAQSDQDATLFTQRSVSNMWSGIGALREAQQSTEIASDERDPGTVGTARARRFFLRQTAQDAALFKKRSERVAA